MAKLYSVYRIRFEDKSEYFGITSQDLARRIEQHLVSKHNDELVKRFDVGMNFEVSIMADKLSKSEALGLGRGYIRTGKNILNIIGPGRPWPQRRLAAKKQQWAVTFTKRQRERIDRLVDESRAEIVRKAAEIGLAIVNKATPEQAQRMRERERLEARGIAPRQASVKGRHEQTELARKSEEMRDSYGLA